MHELMRIIVQHIKTYSSLSVESVHCYYGESRFNAPSEFKSDVIVLLRYHNVNNLLLKNVDLGSE